MAPVHEYRHVELDKVGRGKRVLKPPGGGCSDIFGAGQTPSPQNGVEGQRRVRNYQQSSVFTPDGGSNGHASPTTPTGGMNGSSGRRLSDGNTQDRLFGSPSGGDVAGVTTPSRKVVDRMKSNIFSEDAVDSTPPRPTSLKKSHVPRRNPITGEVLEEDLSPTSARNGNNTTNGHSTRNGNTTPDAGNPIMGLGGRENTPQQQQPCVRIRNPPGGHSSGIF